MSFFIRNFIFSNARPQLVCLSRGYRTLSYPTKFQSCLAKFPNYPTKCQSYTSPSYIMTTQNYTTNSQPVKKKKSLPERQPQLYKYFLIVDLEATCDKVVGNPPVQEIIEFPVLKMNAETLKIESQFHEYVKPRLYPELTEFCTNLTGITQEQIDASSHFPEVMERFEAWLKAEVGRQSHLVVTCGDWDLLTQLPRSCGIDHVRVPASLRKWHNVKQSYNSVARNHTSTMKGILEGLHLSPENQAHRGIADCRNVVNIVVELLKKGMVLQPNKTVSRSVP